MHYSIQEHEPCQGLPRLLDNDIIVELNVELICVGLGTSNKGTPLM